jgi:hypothetical protein
VSATGAALPVADLWLASTSIAIITTTGTTTTAIQR